MNLCDVNALKAINELNIISVYLSFDINEMNNFKRLRCFFFIDRSQDHSINLFNACIYFSFCLVIKWK